MPDNTELVAIIHQTVATTKELAEALQEAVVQSKNGQVELTTVHAQAIASALRINANLVVGLLEENSQYLDRVEELRSKIEG